MKVRHLISIGLAACLLAVTTIGLASPSDAIIPAPDAAAQTQKLLSPAVIDGKDEVVYATLDAAGEVKSIYAVNHFEVTSAGSVTDHGNYESVVNLTNSGVLTQNGGSVSFEAEAGNFYYQGNMSSRDLPWFFDVSYRLDGRQAAPAELAGKSGHMELAISSRQNDSADPTFYDNYMLQITVTLDPQKCANLEAPGSTIATAGTNKIVTYTVLPGSDADFTLRADVQDFTMTGVSIAAVPYSMSVDFPDMDNQLDGLEQLPDAIAQLNDGVAELRTGAQQMISGAGDLTNGSAGIRDGLAQLNANSAALTGASTQINDALSQIAASLSASGGGIDLSQLEQLPQGLTDLAGGLREVSGGLVQLKDSFQPAYAALDGAMQALPDASSADVQAVYGALDPAVDAAAVEALNRVVASVENVRGTYASVKPAFDAVGTTIGTLCGSIDSMAAALDGIASEAGGALSQLDGLSQLGSLAAGLRELSKNYAGFHEGLLGYAGGVSALASNYDAFHSGLSAFTEGVGELSNGIGELSDGTNTLKSEVADLPEMIQSEIDKMKEDYMPADFAPVSFTSPQNTDTDFVQFVLQCDGIEKPDPPKQAETEEQPETFWDRLTALFQ